MAAVANTAAQALLKGLIGSSHTSGSPNTLYVGLSSTAPAITSGVIGNITEPTLGSYARVAVTNNDTEWTVAVRSAVNVNPIQFPTVTAEYDVSPAYYVVFDAATGGNALFFGSLNTPFTLSVGVKLVLAANSVTLTVEV